MRDENKYRLNTVDKMKQMQNEIDVAWDKAEESAKYFSREILHTSRMSKYEI